MIPIVICDTTTNGINLYKQLLRSCPNIHIAATANSSESLLTLLEEGVDASVIVLDINIPFTNTLTLINTIHKEYPEYKVLVHSIISNLAVLKQLLNAGIAGFLCKKETVPIILEEAITNIILEGYHYPAYCNGHLLETIRQHKEELQSVGLFNITKQEEAVFRFLPTAKTSKEIASILGSSKRTIDVHCFNIYKKLGVTTRTGAVEVGSSLRY